MSYNLPVGYLSPSQVNKYLHCPACYERQYVLSERRPVSIALPIGGAVHRAIEEMRFDLVNGAGPNDYVDMAVTHYEWALSNEEIEMANYDKGSGKDEVVRLTAFALPILAALDVQRGISAAEVGVCSEENYLRPGTRFNVPVEAVRDAWPFPTKAFADGLYGGIELLSDLKTAKERRAPDTTVGLQAAWYLRPFHLAGMDFPVVIDQITKAAKPQHVTWSATVTPDQHQQIYRAVLGAAEGISRGDFPPRPGWWCDGPHNWPKFSVAA